MPCSDLHAHDNVGIFGYWMHVSMNQRALVQLPVLLYLQILALPLFWQRCPKQLFLQILFLSCTSQHNRITKLLRQEGSSRDQVHPPAQSRITYSRLSRAMSVGFYNLQGRRFHSFSGQPVPVFDHLHHIKKK